MPINPFRRQLFTYLFLVLVLSSIFYFLIIKSGHLGSAFGLYVTGIMWCPAISAMLTCKLSGRSIASLGWKWGESRYQILSYLIPLAYATIAYVGVWLLHLGGFYDHDFVARVTKSFGLGNLPPWSSTAFYFALAGTVGMVSSCSTALGEEIGWRGFLVPHLAQRFTFTQTAIISGIVWSLWHYPILIFADYNAGTPTWYGLTCFTVMVISISFVFAWMRLKSGSLWTGALLHASHNLFVQRFFDPITTNTGKTPYIIGEFGAALALVSIGVAVYFWSRRDELPRQQEQAASTGG